MNKHFDSFYKKYSKQIFRILLICILAVYLFAPLIGRDFPVLTFLLGISLMLLTFPVMNKSYRTPAIIFLVLGALIMIIYGLPFSTLINGASSMLNLVSILISMQLFAAPVVVGNYGPAVETLIVNHSTKEKHLFLIVTLVSSLFATFLLMGTIPVVLALVGTTIANRVQDIKQFTSAAMTRGYTAVLMWAPGAVVVLLTLQATHTEWTQIFPYTFLLSLIGITTAYMLEWKLVLKERPLKLHSIGQATQAPQASSASTPSAAAVLPTANSNLPSERVARWRMLHIVLVVIGIVAGIYLFDLFTDLSATHCVIFTGIIIFALWMLALRKNPGKKAAMSDYWKSGLLKTNDLAAMFVAIGFFAEAVGTSGIVESIRPFISAAASHEYIFLALLPAVIVLLSIAGIHSFISITIIGNLLASVSLPFSMVPVAIAIVFGSALSFAVSPFAGITLTMSKYLDCKAFDVAVRWNGLYSAVFYVETVLIIWLLVFFKIAT